MKLTRRTVSFAVAILATAAPVMAQDCYDLAKGEPKSLTGRLEHMVFAGWTGSGRTAHAQGQLTRKIKYTTWFHKSGAKVAVLLLT